MDFRFLYHRIRYFIISPGMAWDVVKKENRPIKYVRNSLFFPLLVLVTTSTFFGSILFINTELKVMYSVIAAVNAFLMLYLGIHLLTLTVREIMKAMDLGNDFTIAFKLVVYSQIPLFISLTISRLFESLLFINILSVAGVYIFWIGMEKMINPPEHKKLPMVIASIIAMIIIFAATQIVFSKLTEVLYFTIFA